MNPVEKESLERQYGADRMRRMERSKQVQKVIMILSMLAFFGSTIFGLGKVFKGVFEPEPQTTQPTEEQSATALLQKQEKGYETVLKREPNNPTALEGLVKVRLEQNNIQGAIEPLNNLIKLYPDRQDYQQLLTQLKQGNQK
ncbi:MULTISPECIES: tetratricopeptide repeat protein [Planktothrix]|uniref:Tetratricopeptide repeat protein n=1 Tax=Planktothrix mougeotii LEGE 06226 TaxID=1828728 RepID=A0ABR9U9E3_9CYAN|nr:MULTISPECIES: tetratricopeptide repeat protein [Planktothrix]MBD2483639.1 tetratricopeptide repeat protein [Planktothrix sp. FACHB-1365]MBE9143070.1 tetratricopeptide repeat protein [Planktothrix mougeotii LEGE 06226]